jgi:hypothetical protein
MNLSVGLIIALIAAGLGLGGLGGYIIADQTSPADTNITVEPGGDLDYTDNSTDESFIDIGEIGQLMPVLLLMMMMGAMR